MDLKLQGKIIIVTGGDKEIEEAVSKKLAEEGAISCICGAFNDADLDKTCLDRTVKKYERIDAVVNIMVMKDQNNYFTLVNAAVPSLTKTNGAIINICKRGPGFGFAEDWTNEFIGSSIRMNGIVISATRDRKCNPESLEAIAEMTVFLCSEKSSALRSQFIHVESESVHRGRVLVKVSGFEIDMDRVHGNDN